MKRRYGIPVKVRPFAMLLALAVSFSARAQGTALVRTESGLVQGLPVLRGDVIAYKGIPYAAPPVGNLRWRAPEPPASWEGVRKAYNFGPSCIQNEAHERMPWTWEFMTHGELSEDCLYLNIWTPAKAGAGKRAVLVYIHGGGFGEGSGEDPAYNGEGLARKGLVLVNINYRLGVFGFFSHPELSAESAHNASGNQGLLDQLAALQWVRKNIAAFGGDPQNVTIAGQSAGAASVHALTASPLAKGLFQRAIADSGSGITSPLGKIPGLADAEKDGVKYADSKGARSLTELRAMSWKDLMATPEGGGSAPSAFRFGLSIDGYFLPEDQTAIFAQGKQNDVPTLTGCNADEGGATPHPEITAAEFEKQARQKYGAKADEFLKLYPAGSDVQAAASLNESSRDLERTSMYLWAARRNKTGKTKVFTYYWDHALPGPDAPKYGAFHTSEIPYVMDSLNRSDRPWQEADRKIADLFSSYWVNFATTGDPNGNGLAVWPAVESGSPMTMEIGDRTGPIPVAASAKLEFLKEFLEGTR